MLYAMLLLLFSPPVVQAPRPPQAPMPPQAPREVLDTDAQKYARAYRESLASGKPLVVWIGGNLCPD